MILGFPKNIFLAHIILDDMMNGVALIVSFFGGLALAALVAYFIFKNAVASRVAQAREQLRSELEQLKYEKAARIVIKLDDELGGRRAISIQRRV